MKAFVGRYAYGLAAISSGICALAWHNLSVIGQLPHRAIFIFVAAAIEVVGGLAVLWSGTARAGAIALGSIYFVFALLGVLLIVQHPFVYNRYGNFFEQFSFVSAALIVFACSGRAFARTGALAKIGYYSFGICLISFALEQVFYLPATASLVPKWIPPGQMFWAWATTVAFALAGIALLLGFKARLAAQSMAAMIVGFGLLVWLPVLFADPHHFGNWSETVETFGIAASAWIVAEYRGHEAESASAYLD
jgi:uncharacterized membrane protein YphA (DoxX/SURF4 family)